MNHFQLSEFAVNQEFNWTHAPSPFTIGKRIRHRIHDPLFYSSCNLHRLAMAKVELRISDFALEAASIILSFHG